MKTKRQIKDRARARRERWIRDSRLPRSLMVGLSSEILRYVTNRTPEDEEVSQRRIAEYVKALHFA